MKPVCQRLWQNAVCMCRKSKQARRYPNANHPPNNYWHWQNFTEGSLACKHTRKSEPVPRKIWVHWVSTVDADTIRSELKYLRSISRDWTLVGLHVTVQLLWWMFSHEFLWPYRTGMNLFIVTWWITISSLYCTARSNYLAILETIHKSRGDIHCTLHYGCFFVVAVAIEARRWVPSRDTVRDRLKTFCERSNTAIRRNPTRSSCHVLQWESQLFGHGSRLWVQNGRLFSWHLRSIRRIGTYQGYKLCKW